MGDGPEVPQRDAERRPVSTLHTVPQHLIDQARERHGQTGATKASEPVAEPPEEPNPLVRLSRWLRRHFVLNRR